MKKNINYIRSSVSIVSSNVTTTRDLHIWRFCGVMCLRILLIVCTACVYNTYIHYRARRRDVWLPGVARLYTDATKKQHLVACSVVSSRVIRQPAAGVGDNRVPQ